MTTTQDPPNPPADTATPPAEPATPPAVPPAWKAAVPEKYHRDTAEATLAELAKAYGELEKKLGSGGGKPENQIVIDALGADAELGMADIVSKIGLDHRDLVTQWKKSGSLTPEQYQKLGRAGMTKKAVNEHLEMAAELAAYRAKELRANAVKVVGSEEALNTLLDWKNSTDMTPEERSELQEKLNNPKTQAIALKLIMQEHREAVGAGKAKPLITGSGGAGGEVVGAKDPAEYKALTERAARGDEGALARLRATPRSLIQSWLK